MSWTSDVKEQWNNLPTWGKLTVAGIGVLVVFLGLRAYNTGKKSPSLSADQASSEGGGQVGRSIFPGIQSGQSNVPLLPSNVSPIFSGGGQLVGFQEGAASSPIGQAPKPSLFGVTARSNWSGESGSAGIPIWKNPNANWDEVVTSVPKNTQLQVGSSVQGNYNGKPATYYPVTVNEQTGYVASWDLGNAPPVSSAPANSVPVGGGGRSWGSRLRTYTPQVGDNMNEIAMILGLKGGWSAFKTGHFEHGKAIDIPW